MKLLNVMVLGVILICSCVWAADVITPMPEEERQVRIFNSIRYEPFTLYPSHKIMRVDRVKGFTDREGEFTPMVGLDHIMIVGVQYDAFVAEFGITEEAVRDWIANNAGG